MLNDLLCPLDNSPLTLQERTLICEHGHSFDLAKTGYVNLLPVQHKRSKDPGDSKAMVAARQAFLNAQVYRVIADKVSEFISQYMVQNNKPDKGIRLLDAGCGEGYYLSQLADHPDLRLQDSVGLDISKWAIMAASKRNKTLTWLVGSNAQLPMPAKRFDGVLCLFGFPVWTEFNRVLEDQGVIIVADAGAQHLIELRQQLYPELHPYKAPNYQGISGFELLATESINHSFELNSQQAIMNLLAMTPHMHKAPYAGRKAIEALTHLSLTLDVTFSILRKSAIPEDSEYA